MSRRKGWLRRFRDDRRTRGFAHLVHSSGHVLIPSVAIGFGLPLGWSIWNSGNSGARCVSMPDQLPDPFFFLVGFVSLVLGRLFSYLDEPEDYPKVQPAGSRNITHYAMIIVFFVFACAWFFEAMGVARVTVVGEARAEAISFYIRCAIYLDKVGPLHGAITTAVVALLAFVTGHWLWADHPAVRRTKAAPAVSGPTTT